ncbi:hypothetical protein SLE2022_160660 [Rubroshorea leprosula]
MGKQNNLGKRRTDADCGREGYLPRRKITQLVADAWLAIDSTTEAERTIKNTYEEMTSNKWDDNEIPQQRFDKIYKKQYPRGNHLQIPGVAKTDQKGSSRTKIRSQMVDEKSWSSPKTNVLRTQQQIKCKKQLENPKMIYGGL